MMRLELRTSLFYEKISSEEANLLADLPGNEEFILCYELDSVQGHSIEPDRELLLGAFVFAGRKTEGIIGISRNVSLPQGSYLFVQQRGDRALNETEWLDLAVEQQKDGLWERNKLGNSLYVRFLREDGAVVTQVFRVCCN